nr:acetyl-CoA carboxylase carboxyltransferase beta subunit [Amorphophallus paeoniifolius]
MIQTKSNSQIIIDYSLFHFKATIHLFYLKKKAREDSMQKWWFNSMFSNEELEQKYRLSKSMDSFGPIRYSSGSEDPVISDMDKNVSSWSDSGSCNFSSIAHFFDIIDILSFISDNTFLVRDSNGDSYSINFDIENRIFEIDNDSTFLNELESSFSSYPNSSYMSSGSKSSNRYYYHYMYDTQSSWNNHINSCIDSYLCFEISYISGGTHNYSDSYVYSFICTDFDRPRPKDFDINRPFKHLWVMCEKCYRSNYKKFFKSRLNICEGCGYHLKMSSSDRIEFLIDPGTWDPLDESMVPTDPIEFDSEEEPYGDHIDSYHIYSDGNSIIVILVDSDNKDHIDSDGDHIDSDSDHIDSDHIDSDGDHIDSDSDHIDSDHIDSDGDHIDSYHIYSDGNRIIVILVDSDDKDHIDSYHIDSDGDHIDSDSDHIDSDHIDSDSDHIDSYHIDSDGDHIDSDSDHIDSDHIDSDSDHIDSDHIDSDGDHIDSDSDHIDSDHIDSDGDHIDSDSDHIDSDHIDSDGDHIDSDPIDSDRDPIFSDPIDSDRDPIDSDEDPIFSDPIDSDEDPIFSDPIDSDEDHIDPYGDYIDSCQIKTGLTDAVQTGIGQLNGIPIAIGVMDFEFMGGSMGSVVGEKITRLIEYATNQSLPVIIVCASGGARMQEGSLSLMQMAKISSALYNYQLNKKLFYVSILTSPTTGGVTASFGMLGNIIIAEPQAYIAFAGKRVIEQTLNKTVPEGSQEAEYSFYKGLVDPIVPRNLLKGVLGELFQLHGFLPLTKNESTALDSVICSEQ